MHKPFPDNIERERVVNAAATKLPVPRWQQAVEARRGHHRNAGGDPAAVQGHRDGAGKVQLPDCEAITQAPAPFHATPGGYIGPQLLAMIMFDKFGQHLPLNRQSQRFKFGAAAFAGMPLFRLIEAQVLAAERLHGDETTVPILAKGKTVTGRIWSFVRDDRPFGGRASPAAVYYASPDRRGEHPARHLQGFTGTLQADGAAGAGNGGRSASSAIFAFSAASIFRLDFVIVRSIYHNGTAHAPIKPPVPNSGSTSCDRGRIACEIATLTEGKR